mgnify:CR=1 FL=1
MQTTLTPDQLAGYTSRQLNTFFPDGSDVAPGALLAAVGGALERMDYCFSRSRLESYFRGGQAHFDHLYSDQYLMYLWFVANELWKRGADKRVIYKVYLLNKSLHAFDCAWDTKLPEIFMVIHGVGTVLGKGEFSDFFVIYQGCTVGQTQGRYPKFGRGAGLGAGAAVIGSCELADHASVGAGCTLINTSVPSGKSAFRDAEGRLQFSEGRPGAIATRCFQDKYLF